MAAIYTAYILIASFTPWSAGVDNHGVKSIFLGNAEPPSEVKDSLILAKGPKANMAANLGLGRKHTKILISRFVILNTAWR